ncbi:glycosyltransferase family 2 protein [Pedobacter glucosidilyticus]|uniref:glycosyltransferase family 2 protein n=1 Tax=Pedobacter glucosidilyticus TaxID=1122941 RepID=UPI0026F19549|nr:glycosyltransferase family 2 protein [Pedobacter glucosidilyticus]
MSLVSIITVNYNQPQATVDFLKSIKTHYPTANLEVILVDNGSNENHYKTFHKHYPKIIYIHSIKNIGFAGGNNFGLRAAKGDYLFFLNNDTEIIAGCIETMVSEMEQNPDIGLLSPLILYHEDKSLIQYAGFTPLNYLTGRNNCVGQFENNNGQYEGLSHETGFCHGAAVMCRKTDLLKAGRMDENYFLYYEELDWCEKFKRIGKKIWFTGKTHIYHKESVSVGKESALKTYFTVRNRMLFIRKNTSFLNTLAFSIYYCGIACPKMMVQYFLKGRKDLIKWVLKGVLWNFTHAKNSKNLGFKIKNS